MIAPTGFYPASLWATQLEHKIEIPIEEGKVSVEDLCRQLLAAYDFAPENFNIPELRVRVTGLRGKAALFLLRKTCLETVSFKTLKEDTRLEMTVDSMRVRAVRHRLKGRLVKWLSRWGGGSLAERKYALVLPADVATAQRCVLFIHGVESSASTFDDLRAFLSASPLGEAEGWVQATFEYPDDEAIDRVGRRLVEELSALSEAQPGLRVIVVAHSMGGVVARWALETPDASADVSPGNVDALIMLGTPNHGSYISRLRPALEPLELLGEFGDEPRYLAPFTDGLGEAGWDLWPNSPLLTQLNARSRAPGVRYHLILGDKGLISATQLETLTEKILAKAQGKKGASVYAPKLEKWLRNLDEVVEGKGDGAVSVERGKLAGVPTDIVQLGHVQLLQAARQGEIQPAFEAVLRVLEEERRKK